MSTSSGWCAVALAATLVFTNNVVWSTESLPFTYMTLNGIQDIAISIEDLEPDLAVYGLNEGRINALIDALFQAAQMKRIPIAAAMTDPHAGLLRVRIITNYDANGFYHTSIKLEFRAKVPLGNSAGGFVSQVVWTTAENTVMLASEVEKIDPLVRTGVQKFIDNYKAQNPAPVH